MQCDDSGYRAVLCGGELELLVPGGDLSEQAGAVPIAALLKGDINQLQYGWNDGGSQLGYGRGGDFRDHQVYGHCGFYRTNSACVPVLAKVFCERRHGGRN